MITKLKMTNFKVHEALELHFESGLVALRGANEAGKSTVYNAIVYAMFGSRALPLTLAETVTYGKPESSLKVELDFTFNNIAYHIQRSKSGAVLTTGTTTANGQSEVTKFVENLLGINADTASKLMVAGQNGLRGALEGNEAIPLIEKLANIDLIDTLISKIQEQLPCGNTKQLAENLEELKCIVAPVANYTEINAAIKDADTTFHSHIQKMEEVQKKLTELPVAEAKQTIELARVQELNVVRLRKERLSVHEKLTIVPTLFIDPLPMLREMAELQKVYHERAEAYNFFVDCQVYEPYTGNLEADYVETGENLARVLRECAQIRENLIRFQAMRINDASCNLCGKLLQDIPEVVAKNAEIDDNILRQNVELNHYIEESKKWSVEVARLNNIRKNVTQAKTNYAQISKYVTASTTIPINLTWSGEVPGEPDTNDYTKAIKEAEKAKAESIKAQVTYETLQIRNKAITKELSALSIVYDTNAAEDLLSLVDSYQQEITQLGAKVHHAELYLKEVTNKLEVAKATYAAEKAAYDQVQVSIARIKFTIALYEKHNALIKKLREARPVVAARLWAVVLNTVSNYFSQIRGTQTVVSKSLNSFLVDGHPVGGVSGSTLDALGLAVRMALAKTFLPSVRWLLLDEPAAGMDEERESAMLGTLAGAGFEQVILVSHSDLCDSFAGSVVQL